MTRSRSEVAFSILGRDHRRGLVRGRGVSPHRRAHPCRGRPDVSASLPDRRDYVGFRRNVWEADPLSRRRESRVPVYQLSPNIELLFKEAGEAPDRVRAAAAAGFDAVEVWFSTDKDLDALGQTTADTGLQLTSLLAGPRMGYTFPGTDLAPFHEGLDTAVEHAKLLGCPRVVLASGVGFPGMNRTKNLQIITDMFREAVERHRGSGVEFVLEPVNSRVDHPGALTDRTEDAVVVAKAVGDDSFGILYDLYHSIAQGEDPATELANAAGFVKYVQLADAPGRHEPGSGDVDWPAQLAA